MIGYLVTHCISRKLFTYTVRWAKMALIQCILRENGIIEQ
jgi:hypothetical protein